MASLRKLTLEDISLNHKVIFSLSLSPPCSYISLQRVLMRVDFNIPMKNDKITSTARIEATIPSIQYVLDKGASVVLCSHLDRPRGRRIPHMSLKPGFLLHLLRLLKKMREERKKQVCLTREIVVSSLESLLKRPVCFLDDCVGPKVEQYCSNLKQGEVVLLENLRYHPEEEGSGIDENGVTYKVSNEKYETFVFAVFLHFFPLYLYIFF